MVGKQRGLEDTRGTLFYEYARLVKEIQPKVFIYENVKAILSNDEGRTWETMKEVFSTLGYKVYYTFNGKPSVLNARDYGIPQNRERIFIVSIRKDIDKNNFVFPSPVELKLKLKDLLEDTVDDKFYLTENGIGRLIKKNNKLLKDCQNPNISSCLIAGYHKMSGNQNQYIAESNKVEKVAGLYDTENKKHQAGSIYNSNRNISNINYNG